MAETISMPKLGFDMAEGTLVRWVKNEGENVNKGDVLAEIETDKATVEVESSASGVVRKLLVNEGISAEIVDLRTLRPLDMEPVLESFKKTNRAIVVEEGWKSYGVGSEVVSRMYEEAFDYVDAPILRVAQKEVPLPYNRTLEQSALPQVPDIVAAVKEVLK